MSTFADFALLAAVPSSGGIEILRAQRVLPTGPGPRVHLALFGRNEGMARRVVAAAHGGAAVMHPAIARIYEVGRFDGVVYGVGDPSEGLDLSSLMGGKKGVAVELAVAVVASLARIAISVHDAGGPGYRGPPLGFGAVVGGGLRIEAIFLEPSGAVRLRPLAAAGVDPDAPSSFRAPEREASMADDVYALGRMLMALSSGDASGKTVPRLPSSSSLSALVSRMVHTQKAERPSLHDTVVRLDAALQQLADAPADQVIRAALAGPLRPLVVDPGFALEAPPRLVEPLRLQLPWVYSTIERLWPTLTSSTVPPPPLLGPGQLPQSAGGGVDVFADARRGGRVRAKTAATVLFNDVAMPAQAQAPEGSGRRKTKATRVMAPAELRTKALPPSSSASASPPSATQAGATPSSRPFVPPPPPPSLATAAVPGLSAEEDRVFTGAVRRAEPSAPAVGVMPSGDAFHVTPGDEFDDRTQVLPRADSSFGRHAAPAQRRPASRAAAKAGVATASPDDDDVFATDRAAARPRVASAAAPPPLLSDPGGETVAYDLQSRPITSEYNVDAIDSSGLVAPKDPRATVIGSAARAPDDEEPLLIDSAAEPVMVGEAGRAFDEHNNPFRASTRMVPPQAMVAPVDIDDARPRVSAKAQQRAAPSGAVAGHVPLADGDELRTELVSASEIASMLRGIDAARAAGASSARPQTESYPAKATSSVAREQRVPTPPSAVVEPSGTARLVIEAPEGASVSVNGAVVGVGKITMEVGAAARCVVKVSLAGYLPFTTVVMVQGRPRVRVRPVLKPR